MYWSRWYVGDGVAAASAKAWWLAVVLKIGPSQLTYAACKCQLGRAFKDSLIACLSTVDLKQYGPPPPKFNIYERVSDNSLIFISVWLWCGWEGSRKPLVFKELRLSCCCNHNILYLVTVRVGAYSLYPLWRKLWISSLNLQGMMKQLNGLEKLQW